MERFVINGKKELSGTVIPSGSKNEALPVLAATLLTEEKIILKNMPKIRDIEVMIEVIQKIGGVVEWIDDTTLYVVNKGIHTHELPREECKRIRASILFLGPMVSKFKKVMLPPPGGDVIGRRRLDTHFIGLEMLGANIELSDVFDVSVESNLYGTEIFLDEPSVTATENIIMAATLAKGVTIIRNAAQEPHVTNLIKFLNGIGARIEGINTSTLYITGVDRLYGGEHTIGPDYLEIGSFIGLAAVTNSEIKIKNCRREDLHMILLNFKKLGVKVNWDGNDIIVPKNQELKIKDDMMKAVPQIYDGPWPAFPSDLMSILITVATQAEGTIVFFEKMFEGRMYFVDHLMSMGAKIIPCDPHRAVIVGPSELYATKLDSPDVRAGMALLIASLVAKGESSMYNIRQIDRGYANIDKKLQAIGADIVRESLRK